MGFFCWASCWFGEGGVGWLLGRVGLVRVWFAWQRGLIRQVR